MKKLNKIFEIIAAIPIAVALILILIYEISGNEFLVGSVNDSLLYIVLLSTSAVFYLISAIIALFNKGEKNRISSFIPKISRFVIVCICIFNWSYDYEDKKYYEFTSPDGNHTVVAEEWSYLLGGGVRFYERKNPFFVSHKDLLITDDGYRAISSGDYTIEWTDNSMLFTAQNGNGIYKTEIIELQ
ncbi:MAG: hypothetical protein IJO36_09585 [Clostridia bacterium]|nr:hypothetical protein [Clostridia bacterium]